MTISIITGGQTGVDTGGLRAAVDQKVTARGIFPALFKREEKAPQWLLDISTCIASDKYDARTRAVVKECQVCIVIAPDVNSTPGTALTVKLAKDEGMQLWVFDNVADRAKWGAEAHAMAYWLKQLEKFSYPKMNVMVAGPRGAKWRAGEDVTLSIMMAALKHFKELK